MQGQRTDIYPPLQVRHGVLIVDGYGIRLCCHHGALVIEDGIGPQRRSIKLHRATSRLKRLVLLGHEGFLTLEAIRWLTDVGAALIHIDRNGSVLATSSKLGLDDPRLRRAQAAAVRSPTGLEISRFLIGRKLDGQAQVLATIEGGSDAAALGDARRRVDSAGSLDDLRRAEADGALAYWHSWAHMPVRFGTRDAERLPEHWLRFGQRGSPLTGQPRSAANPANALLNYCYALLEAECRIACLAVGLDPGLGIIHADQKARDSLALDLMEAVRADVDDLVLAMLRTHTFSRKDFYENREGVCRILAPLTHHLAERAPELARAVAPVAERTARMLAEGSGKWFTTPTLLTQDRRSQGRAGQRRKPRQTAAQHAPMPSACRSCGLILEDRDRSICDECLPERQREQHAAFSASGPAAVSHLRAAGSDPMHSPEARRKVSLATAESNRERAAWNREHEPGDPELFVRDILPVIQSIPLRRLAQATGLSIQHCGMIRRGLRVPHPRHWEALKAAR